MKAEWACGIYPPCYVKGDKWLAVAIPKCATTYLEQLALRNSEQSPQVVQALSMPTLTHAIVNQYGIELGVLHPLRAPMEGEYKRFAVWVDPVRRAESVYRNFCLGQGESRFTPPYYEMIGLKGCDPERFVEFVEFELKGSFIEEHLRPQSMYYDITDVDEVVAIGQLNEYMTQFNVKAPTSKPNSTGKFKFSLQLNARLAEAYAQDYEFYDLLKATNKLRL